MGCLCAYSSYLLQVEAVESQRHMEGMVELVMLTANTVLSMFSSKQLLSPSLPMNTPGQSLTHKKSSVISPLFLQGSEGT